MSTGDDFLSSLNISHGDRWTSLAVLAAYSLSNIAITYCLVFVPLRVPDWLSALVTKATGRTGVGRKRAEQVAAEEWARELAFEREHPEVHATAMVHDPFG